MHMSALFSTISRPKYNSHLEMPPDGVWDRTPAPALTTPLFC